MTATASMPSALAVDTEPVDPRLDRIAEAATTSYREWFAHHVAIFLGDHPELAGPNEPKDFGNKAWDLIREYTEAQAYGATRVITMIAGMRNPALFCEGCEIAFENGDFRHFLRQVGEEILYRDLCKEVESRWTVQQARPWRDEVDAAKVARS